MQKHKKSAWFVCNFSLDNSKQWQRIKSARSSLPQPSRTDTHSWKCSNSKLALLWMLQILGFFHSLFFPYTKHIHIFIHICSALLFVRCMFCHIIFSFLMFPKQKQIITYEEWRRKGKAFEGKDISGLCANWQYQAYMYKLSNGKISQSIFPHVYALFLAFCFILFVLIRSLCLNKSMENVYMRKSRKSQMKRKKMGVKTILWKKVENV